MIIAEKKAEEMTEKANNSVVNEKSNTDSNEQIA